jgi:hypothetical protein
MSADSDKPLDWTPLIGMALLLFGLFAIGAHLARIDADERSRLPLLALARPPAARDSGSIVHDIVASRGKRVSGTLRSVPDTTGDEWVVVVSGRECALTELESELRQRAPRDAAEASVIIRAEETVPHGVVQQVVHGCQAAGITRFSLQPLQEPRTK